jgi:hypothetical protein
VRLIVELGHMGPMVDKASRGKSETRGRNRRVLEDSY